ncbi:permease-like cell division protein FtsX [Allobacillus halotolerans]|uniref:Cell division protein FtsX n=1 Tax=Allobacillus halotolerans TaxID=570278 RepID=A0ABS6GQR0_9BACI|nr:permease-like cell division protein FtsX [Allobacillus halotolerans]MBU6081450.1 permease-like cell division protein FtsX [Allobacillus halotolerans]
MKLSTMRRHVREGTKNIVRNSWMTVASVGAVTTTLVLVGIFLALMFNLNQLAENIENEAQMKVYVERTAEDQDIQALEKQINEISDISEMEFSSKEDELEGLISDMGESGDQWELFEQFNPLNDAFNIKTYEPEQLAGVANQIEQMDNVEEVNYMKDVVDRLIAFNDIARWIGIIFIGALLLTAIFLISNTIKMTIIARQTEIGIMKLVGAKNSFIRWPFFVEGALMGVLGSIIPIAVVAGGYYYLYNQFADEIPIPFFELLPANPFIWQISGILLGIGVVIGIWGSVMSVRKFLRV